MKFTNTLLFLSFLSLASFSYAQQRVIDSLKNELSIHPKKDSNRVNILNELAYQLYPSDVNATQSYLDQADAILKTIDYKYGKARNLFVKGYFELMKGNSDVTTQYYQEALQLYEAIDAKRGMAECYDALGVMATYKSDYKTAIEYSKKDLAIRKEIGTNEEIAYNIYFLGGLYAATGDLTEALRYYEQSLKLFEAEDDKRGIAVIYEVKGVTYLEQGNYTPALEYLNKSLFLKEKYANAEGIHSILNNIGVIYEDLGKLDKASAYYQRSLDVSKKNNYKRSIIKTTIYLGSLFKKKKEYEQAFEFYNQALEKSEEINYLDNAAICLNHIGFLYLAQGKLALADEYLKKAERISLDIGRSQILGKSYRGLASTYLAQKKYKEAMSYTLKSKEIADELNSLSQQCDVQELLYNIYKDTRDYKKALTSHEEYQRLNDSLFNKENIEKMAQLEYEYKYKQTLDAANIRELELRQSLEKSQRNYLLAIIGFLVFSMLLGAIIFYQKLKNIKATNQNIITEQKLLRSQMTPHFIFNSLSVLQGMILNKEEEKSISYLSKFSKLLRISLENSRDKMVLLSQELAGITNYLELQQLEENHSEQYSISIDDKINPSLFKIPPMLIQPFIENAIEHGFKDKKGLKEIRVELKKLDDQLICTITDNGVGIDAQKNNGNQDKKSLATTITSERLKLLSKDLKMKASVTIEDRKKYNEEGTMVTLVIPHLKIK